MEIIKTLPDIRSHLEYGLLYTSRTALDLDYWKRLCWLIESQEQSPIQIQNILGSILYRWNRFLWNNAFGVSSNLWLEHKDGLFNGNVLDLATKNISDMVSFYVIIKQGKHLTGEFQGPVVLETAFAMASMAHLA